MGYGSHFANALLNPDEVENRSFFEIDQALRNNKWPSASVVEEAKQLVSENPSIVDERMTPTQAETISMLIKKLENGELDG